MRDRLGPNDRQPCGTDARRVTHRAHGEACRVCGINWPVPNVGGQVSLDPEPSGLLPADETEVSQP